MNGDTLPRYVPPQPTGRRLIFFAPGTRPAEIGEEVSARTGIPVASNEDYGSFGATVRAGAATGSIVLLDRLSVGLISGSAAQAQAAEAALSDFDEVEDVRPEFWMFADRGPWQDSTEYTWGIEAVGALASSLTGKGVKLAVLDTGLDFRHPDFAPRKVVFESFVAGETADDVQGHGTHVSGTAAGGGGGPIKRYGVAHGAELHHGKVLNNKGAGREFDIIAGIEWALSKGCDIINLSLGRPVTPTEPHDPQYEAIGARALAQGALLIAAAGNESDRRYNYIAPVGAPANAPSIMAVAAVGSDEGIASFSCGGVGTGRVDLAGPGVGIHSSFPSPRLYKAMPGTSMAAPHVAGVAALIAESDPALRGQALWDALVERARALGDPRDFGAGMVQVG